MRRKAQIQMSKGREDDGSCFPVDKRSLTATSVDMSICELVGVAVCVCLLVRANRYVPVTIDAPATIDQYLMRSTPCSDASSIEMIAKHGSLSSVVDIGRCQSL
jgi:hypothetical protein